MDDTNFLIYLKKEYPYLYDIEMSVRDIQARTGFGDLSTSLTIRFKKVEISDIGEFTKTVYRESKIWNKLKNSLIAFLNQ